MHSLSTPWRSRLSLFRALSPSATPISSSLPDFHSRHTTHTITNPPYTQSNTLADTTDCVVGSAEPRTHLFGRTE